MTDLTHNQLSAILARVRTALGGAQLAEPDLLADLKHAEQWLDSHLLPLLAEVHVAFIDHREGGNLYAALSREALMSEIAAFCREWWPEIRDERDPATLGDEQLAEIYFERHEDEYLWTERLAVEGAVREAVSPLHIRRHLVISTSHISPATVDLFDQWASLPEARPLGVAEAGYGWFVPTDAVDDDELKMVPPDLRAAIDLARRHGCRWLLLDRDADCVDGLETFDW